MSGRASNIDVKKINRLNTIRAILSCDRISQRELAEKLKISWPTVLQNVKELLAYGLIEEVGAFESTGGRKACAFAPVRDARIALGLEITQNHVGIVLIDLSGGLVRFTRTRMSFSMEEAYFEFLGEAVQQFVKEAECPEDRLLGVGFALPGIMDESGETLAYSHALGLRNVPTSIFGSHIPYSCIAVNDANAAGFAELRNQSVKRNMVYLSLSNSVGGAILPGGTFYTGDNQRGGEFGHSTLVPDGKLCYCGKQGCLDAYCSAKVLAAHTGGNLEAFFEQMRQGDAALQVVWEEYLDWLAIGVNNLRMAFDCDVIVGGYVGKFLEEFADSFRERLARRNTFEPEASYFKPCCHKFEAAAVGAALIQVETFLHQL
jgi:predicted NBD/HSP70 family sugar kinase